MGTTSRWTRVRTLVVAGAAAASGLLLAVGATPAGATTSATSPHTTSATYKCSAKVPIEGTYTWKGAVKFSGKSSPATTKPGTAVKVSGFQISVTIPKPLVDEAGGVVRSIWGTVKTVDVTATDSKTTTVNAAGKGISIPKTKISKTSPAITFKLPKTAKTVTGWKASKAGTMTFKSGKIAITLDASFDGSPVSVPVTCSPDPAKTFTSTKVS